MKTPPPLPPPSDPAPSDPAPSDPASLNPDKLQELASLAGIVPEYYDMWGNLHTVPLSTKEAILRSMGLDDFKAALREQQNRPWNRLIEPVLVCPHDEQPASVPVHFTAREGPSREGPSREGEEKDVTVRWSLKDEHGAVLREMRARGIAPAKTKSIEGTRYVRLDLQVGGELLPGYYTFDVQLQSPLAVGALSESMGLSGSMRLIITPAQCHGIEGRAWGPTVNLYAQRPKEGSWGMGGLGALRQLIRLTGDLGGGFVGLNPLHAIHNSLPFGTSPYSPISRLYGNYIYLGPEDIPGLEASSGGLPDEFKKQAKALGDMDMVDYEALAALTALALEKSFSTFMDRHYRAEGSPEAREFKAYIREEGGPLELFALFMALAKWFASPKDKGLATAWWLWPEGYRRPDGAGVAAFKEQNPDAVLYWQYVQWLLDRSLRACREAALEAGMKVGLYQDLAVGSIRDGSDAWSYPEIFAREASVGVPPDNFNPMGQDWGFPPLIPSKLRESGYELFIQTIRKNLKHAGALRIDHALGLFRLFWIPEGLDPREGAYVNCPSEDLLGIIALESQRSKAVIVAEDLGTVGNEVREALKRYNMLSYRLFYFERNWPGRDFLKPHEYPEAALVAVTTHDLPTLAGFWSGRDIEVKSELGLYPDDSVRQWDKGERACDKALMLKVLHEAGTLPEGFPENPDDVPGLTPELCLAVYEFLAKTPSKLVSISLEDLLGVIEQQNMPGTVGPSNWSRKLPLDVDGLKEDGRLKALGEIFRRYGFH